MLLGPSDCPRLRFNVLSIDYVRVTNCFYDYDDYDYAYGLLWYCCLLGPLFYVLLVFIANQYCLLVVLVKLSVLGQLSHLSYSSWR